MYKAVDKWLIPYLRGRVRRRPRSDGPRHVMLCICDHFEPFHDADAATARARVRRWARAYPKLFGDLRDADNRPLRHTFFYPIEQYDRSCLDRLADVCRQGFGEVEVHLHHDRDTPAGLRGRLHEGVSRLGRHGCLSRDADGRARFGFVHGNWALDNSNPCGDWCGVRNELRVLKDAGCYADFTMPSAPHPTQTRIINSIYYALPGDRPKSHDQGTAAWVGDDPAGIRDRGFLLVQGPLALDWGRRKWGLLPRLERGDLTAANPPTDHRARLWVRQCIGVRGRADWIFVKLHTHGAVSPNADMLLSDAMVDFHRRLLAMRDDEAGWRLHYVTARELVNIVHAAEQGRGPHPGVWRDAPLTPPPVMTEGAP